MPQGASLGAYAHSTTGGSTFDGSLSAMGEEALVKRVFARNALPSTNTVKECLVLAAGTARPTLYVMEKNI